MWALVALDLVLILITYSRIAPEDLYNVTHSGIVGGLSRALVEVNFPVALIALAVLLCTAPRPRWLAIVAGALCLVVVIPGVVSQDHLDARWVNVVPALGVVLAFVLTIRARPVPGRPRADWLRIVLAVVATLAALPWIAAALGLYGPPPFQTSTIVSYHGNEPHPAVHHGIHHGWQGLLMIFTALLLSRLRSSRVAQIFLSLMLAYGIANMVNDGWLEQIAERGWTSRTFPGVLEPKANWGWLLILVATPVIWAAWFGYRPRK